MRLIGRFERPIVLIVGFNLFTLAVFLTAPVEWNSTKIPLLVFFVILCQTCLLIGFQVGFGKGGWARTRRRLPVASLNRLTDVIFVVYALTFLVIYAFKLELSPFDVSGIVKRMVLGFLDPQLGYQLAINRLGVRIVPWTVFFVASIFDQLFFILGFLQWHRLNLVRRVLFILFICIELFFAVGRGASFGAVSMATTFLLARMAAEGEVGRKESGGVRLFAMSALLFAGSIAFFSYNLYARSGNVERETRSFEFGPLADDAVVWSAIPRPLEASYLNVVSYLGQGYYHTSLAFDLDFRPTWLLCNNPALSGLGQALGYDCWPNSYMHRLEALGVDEYVSWHSAYTWYASDVSFYGVPVLLFLIAYVFGSSWARSREGDGTSQVVFVVFGNVLLYLFANNTYLSSVFYSFLVLMPFWLLTRMLGVTHLSKKSTRGRDSFRHSVIGQTVNSGLP